MRHAIVLLAAIIAYACGGGGSAVSPTPTPSAVGGGAPTSAPTAAATPRVLVGCTAISQANLGLDIGAPVSNPKPADIPTGPFTSTGCNFDVGGGCSLTISIFTANPDFSTLVQAGAGSYQDPASAVANVGDQAMLYYGKGADTVCDSATLDARKGSRVVTVALLRTGMSQLEAQTYTTAIAKQLFQA